MDLVSISNPITQVTILIASIVSTFTPIIISDLGFSGLNSLLLVMPAGVVIGTIELTAPFLATKFPGWRSYLVAITVSGTLLASLLLWLLPQSATGGKLFAVYILASYGGGYAVLMSLVIANSAGYTKRSLGSSGMFVGYCIGKSADPIYIKWARPDMAQETSLVPWSSCRVRSLSILLVG
jgi:hypothetical protein